MKKRGEKRKAKKLQKNIIIIVLIVLVLLIIIFVGRPFISEEKGFWDELKGELAAKKAKKGVLTTDEPFVDACTTDSSGEPVGCLDTCKYECGDSGFCIPTGKKGCAFDDTLCIEESESCPCSGSDDFTSCDECAEECKDVGSGSPDWKCSETGKRQCPDGSCKDESGSCECVPSGISDPDDFPDLDSLCPDDCEKCSGSPDYVCEFNSNIYIECGDSCCPDEMVCCDEAGPPALGVCCEIGSKIGDLIDPTFSACRTGGPFNFCNEMDCSSPDYLAMCQDPGVDICCEGPKKGSKGQTGLCKDGFPYCTIKKSACKTDFGETICKIFESRSSSAEDQVLCCSSNEACIEVEGLSFCATTPGGCPEGKFLCPGGPPFDEMTVCCESGEETCGVQPNGFPICKSL